MTRAELTRASERLESAADATTNNSAAERLRDLAGQLDRLADSSHGPDHGRMARIQTALGDLQDDVASEVAATIEAADDDIAAYRETVEGV